MKLLPILLICIVEMLGNFQYKTMIDLSTITMYENISSIVNKTLVSSLWENEKVDRSALKRFLKTLDEPTFAKYLEEINVKGKLFERDWDHSSNSKTSQFDIFHRNYQAFFIYDIFFTLVFLLITDGLGYRWIIILGSVSATMRSIMYYSDKSKSYSISLAEFLNAVHLSSMIATHTYLYSKIRDKSTYQKIAAYVAIAGILGLLCFFWTRHQTDNNMYSYINILSDPFILCTLFLCSYFLPPVDDEKSNTVDEITGDSREANLTIITRFRNIMLSTLKKVQEGAMLAWINFKTTFTNKTVLKWSMWYTTISCFVSLMNYYEISFIINWETEINSKEVDLYRNLDKEYKTKDLSPHEMIEKSFKISDIIKDDKEILKDFRNDISAMILIPLFSTGVILLILCSKKLTIWKARENLVLCLISITAFIVMVLVQLNPTDFPTQFKRTQILLIIVRVSLTVCFWEIVQLVPKNSYALVIGFNIFVSKVLNRIIFYHAGDNVVFPSYEGDFMIPFTIWFALMGLVFGAFAIKPSFFEELLEKLPNRDLKLSRRERNDNGV